MNIAIISPIHQIVDRSLKIRPTIVASFSRDDRSDLRAHRSIRSAHECIVNRERGIVREEAFRSRESHRKHPRRRGPSSISSLRLSMTSRRRKYHAVREVQSCGPDVWSRSQSFPDSQKFSITSLFDNTLLSVRFSIGRSVRGSGKRASRLVTAPPPFRPTGNRVDNPRQHFVSCA